MESGFTTAVSMGVYIYVTGFNLENIFEYDPYQNIFRDLRRGFQSLTYKSLIKTPDTIIILADKSPSFEMQVENREKKFVEIPATLEKPAVKGNTIIIDSLTYFKKYNSPELYIYESDTKNVHCFSLK